MKFLQFFRDEKLHVGVLHQEWVVDLHGAKKRYPRLLHFPITDMLSILQLQYTGLGAIQDAIQKIARLFETKPAELAGSVMLPLRDVKLTAPILNPQKIIAVGLNYRDHCEENRLDIPEFPVTFAKLPSAIIGPGEAIQSNPAVTNQVDYEGEFAFIIGKKARNVPREKALDYVAGYTILNDVSARDLQFREGQWVRAKSLDTFCPLGPWLVTKDEIGDKPALEIKTTLNGTVMQHSNTRHLIFDIPYLIWFLSKGLTLFPGDIITTGTPGGVGYWQDPKVFLKPGDKISVEIEKLGTLTNPVN